MLGAIFGDIVGSVYEFDNLKSKEFPLFRSDAHFTDDTVMTLAVAQGIMGAGGDTSQLAPRVVARMQELGEQYPDAGYGLRFISWLSNPSPRPYNSWGNGSAMRISPAGWAFATLEDTVEAAAAISSVSHNHPEAIAGAQATAGSIFLARSSASKEDIREYVRSTYGYPLDATLDEIRPKYEFTERCLLTVPPAIEAFLESDGVEDTVRNAISVGGDSDTLAAIAGSIAEAYYGMPEDIATQVMGHLDARLAGIVEAWQSWLASSACRIDAAGVPASS